MLFLLGHVTFSIALRWVVERFVTGGDGQKQSSVVFTPPCHHDLKVGRPSGFPSQESFTLKLHTAHPIVIFFSNYIHFLKKYNTMLNTKTANNGKCSTILKSQKSLVEPRKEIKDDLHGGKLPVLLLSLVCDGSAL